MKCMPCFTAKGKENRKGLYLKEWHEQLEIWRQGMKSIEEGHLKVYQTNHMKKEASVKRSKISLQHTTTEDVLLDTGTPGLAQVRWAFAL